MDDTLFRVLVRLMQIRVELGEECYKDAVYGALVAIGRSAMQAAQSHAGSGEPERDNVVRFPSREGASWTSEDSG